MLTYVVALSDRNAPAAAWFLLTGGKYGFSSRQATVQEAKQLLEAMWKVAVQVVDQQNPSLLSCFQTYDKVNAVHRGYLSAMVQTVTKAQQNPFPVPRETLKQNFLAPLILEMHQTQCQQVLTNKPDPCSRRFEKEGPSRLTPPTQSPSDPQEERLNRLTQRLEEMETWVNSVLVDQNNYIHRHRVDQEELIRRLAVRFDERLEKREERWMDFYNSLVKEIRGTEEDCMSRQVEWTRRQWENQVEWESRQRQELDNMVSRLERQRELINLLIGFAANMREN